MFASNARFEAIIFDLDGTLLDTLDDIADAANSVLRREGMPTHDVNAYKHFVGDGVRELVVRILPEDRCSDEVVDRIKSAYQQEYRRHWNRKTKPFDGIPEVLTVIAARGLKMAVLSNKPDDFVKLCVAEYFASSLFDPVLGDDPKRPRKPDPTAAHQIARAIGVTADRVLFVGDSGVDMETAHAAGMFAVGVPWGFRSREELERAGARTILNRPHDLIELI